MLRIVLILAASYLLGSIPFGYLLVRIFRGEDIRRSGSGNIGATNVSRRSPVLGVLTLLLDAIKGSAAVLLATACSTGMNASVHYTEVSAAALLAVVGHTFPVWLGFRGGKGVATGLGSFAVFAPISVLVAAGVFVLVLAAFRYVSLASILAVATFPVCAWWMREHRDAPAALALMTLTALLIIAKHHQNIRRLLAGTENRFGSRHT